MNCLKRASYSPLALYACNCQKVWKRFATPDIIQKCNWQVASQKGCIPYRSFTPRHELWNTLRASLFSPTRLAPCKWSSCLLPWAELPIDIFVPESGDMFSHLDGWLRTHFVASRNFRGKCPMLAQSLNGFQVETLTQNVSAQVFSQILKRRLNWLPLGSKLYMFRFEPCTCNMKNTAFRQTFKRILKLVPEFKKKWFLAPGNNKANFPASLK